MHLLHVCSELDNFLEVFTRKRTHLSSVQDLAHVFMCVLVPFARPRIRRCTVLSYGAGASFPSGTVGDWRGATVGED